MAKNVIVMIGDGMGWEVSRAGAVQSIIEQEIADFQEENPDATNQEVFDTLFAGDTLQDPEYYTEGEGFGTSYQQLGEYAISTTGNAYIRDSENPDESRGISALEGNPFNHNTGQSEVRDGFAFNPSATISEGIANGTYDDTLLAGTGNVPIFDLEKGGESPWDPDYYENRGNTSEGFQTEYIKNVRPDSAGTATGLYTGVKTYVGAMSVDIFEESVETTSELALANGQSTGVVSTVPFNHATPAAAIAHTNQRNKLHPETFDQERAGGNDNGINDEVDEFGHPIANGDNILYQIVNETKPTVVLGGGHPLTRGGDERYITFEQVEELKTNEDFTFLERGPGASDALAQTAASLDPEAGDRLMGIYGARGQGGNLPWRGANGDYSEAGTVRDSGKQRTERPLEEGETDESFIAREVDENPNLPEMTEAALDVLGDDPDGFWVMIEGGDIDWSAHDEDLDANLGTQKDFNESVEVVKDWIANNGGFEENLLIVTADHDHYFTLLDNFPEVLAQDLLLGDGGLSLTEDGAPFNEELGKSLGDAEASGHFWGSDFTVNDNGTPDDTSDDITVVEDKYAWGRHTNRPVPVYFEGPQDDVDFVNGFLGEGYEAYGEEVAGVGTYVDQVHLGVAQLEALAETDENELVFDAPQFGGIFDSETSEGFNGNRDVLFAGSDDNQVFTSEAVGRNRLYTSTGSDEVIAGRRDRVFGGDGNDVLDASEGQGKNRLYGQEGNDDLFAGTDDRLFGGQGDDELDSNIGQGGNRLFGGQGDDQFFVGAGDVALGGEGNDQLFNDGAGDNTFTGGEGADQFWILNGQLLGNLEEMTTITDFSSGVDVLGINSTEISDFDALTITEENGNSLVQFNAQTIAMVNGATGLDASDFAFA